MAHQSQKPDANAWWNINIPAADHTFECPDYLQAVNDKAGIKENIGIPDEDFERHTWDEVREIAKRQSPGDFSRVPSEQRCCQQWRNETREEYGSVSSYLLEHRLRWTNPWRLDSGDFDNPDHYKILWNDWPYGVERDIVHLIVWLKFDLAENNITGRLTRKARARVNAFVGKTLKRPCGNGNVVWFRNVLRSVRTIEHFHVMLYKPDSQFVQDITNGDVASNALFNMRS